MAAAAAAAAVVEVAAIDHVSTDGILRECSQLTLPDAVLLYKNTWVSMLDQYRMRNATRKYALFCRGWSVRSHKLVAFPFVTLIKTTRLTGVGLALAGLVVVL